MLGYYVTEKHGALVAVFPIRKDLRYAIPFKEPEETRKIPEDAAERSPGSCVTYGDDGEKFGVWPKTYEWVFEKGWLGRFFKMLEENADWIRLRTLSEARSESPPSGRVYLPATSYHEMTEWALPTPAGRTLQKLTVELKQSGTWERQESFIRGGYWDNFFAKYEEANRMHKRMLHVSAKVQRCPAKSAHTEIARRALYQGQCNCAYWHGLFGGLYLNYLRDAVYRHLARAETLADLILHGGIPKARAYTAGFDADGAEEIIAETPWFRAVIDPADGGSLADLVLVRQNFCVTNVMSRREEIYHASVRNAVAEGETELKSAHDIIVAKEPNLERHLRFDRYARSCLRDFFVDGALTPETLREGQWTSIDGGETAEHAARIRRPRSGTSVTVELVREAPRRVGVTKELIFSKDSPAIDVIVTIRNLTAEPFSGEHAVEWNLSLLARDADDRRLDVDAGKRDFSELFFERSRTLRLTDGWQNFSLFVEFGADVALAHYPVETVSQSESGFERVYQGACITTFRPIDLPPKGKAQFAMRLTLSDLLQ
ncbi:MAG: DUF1926 domain-containing protein [Deltaproteobacteria bacterium]|nr:DUF1926 domain-containing protein [Deltaproteobacteria bacterium]